jgi:hypothetical protein
MRDLLMLGPLLVVFGCWRADDTALFAEIGIASGGAAATAMAGSSSAESGTSSGSAQGGGTSLGGAQPAAGTSASALGGLPSTGGSSGTGNAGGGNGAGGQHMAPPVIEDCAMLPDAVVSDLDGHCYRINHENLSFSDAQSACHQAGGHLVSVGSSDENEWVAALHDGEHWLGATDGRADTAPGVGPYDWVNGEAWAYSDWEDGQPNAYETDCPDDDDEADCFEHCAFQTDEGDWKDRSCWHTIVSICEWDVGKSDGAAGGSGPTDEP